MAVNLSPVGGVAAQFFDNSGYPLTGGKLYSYAAGTTTPATTYTSSNGATAHSNPIVLDAAGRVPAGGEIWLTDGVIYKFVLKTSTDTLIATYDNITGINSNSVSYTNQQEIITATAGQTVFPLSISYQPGANSLSVFVDGVNQYGPGAQYSYVETDSTTVTFNSGLHVGAEVKFTTTQQQGAGAVDAEQVSYQPPFTGSVATNVEAKLSEIVSVKDFGAVGDGVTDDTAAIQAALDWVDDSEQTLYFPAGDYVVTAGLTAKWCILQGDGAGASNILFKDFTGLNGITFSQTAEVDKSAGVLDLGLKLINSNGATCISTPRNVSLNNLRAKYFFENLAFSGVDATGFVRQGFEQEYGWNTYIDLGDCWLASINNIDALGTYRIDVDPATQTLGKFLVMDGDQGILTARITNITTHNIAYGAEIKDRVFWMFQNVDIAQSYVGILQTRDPSTLLYGEGSLQAVVINAQLTGVDLTDRIGTMCDHLTINRDNDGYDHGNEWVGLKLTTSNKCNFNNIKIYSGFKTGGGRFTGNQIGVKFIGGYSLTLSNAVLQALDRSIQNTPDGSGNSTNGLALANLAIESNVTGSIVFDFDTARRVQITNVVWVSGVIPPTIIAVNDATTGHNINISNIFNLGTSGGYSGTTGAPTFIADFGAGLNEKIWSFVSDNGDLRLQASTDDQSSAVNAILINRTGTTIDSIALRGLINTTRPLQPDADNTWDLGTAAFRWKEIYAANGTINTSDAREKTVRVDGIDPAVLRAWGKVNFSQYKFNAAIAEKGDNARWHFGVIAQQVKEAFESEGLDAFEYGLLCFDTWEDTYDYEYDDQGNKTGNKIKVINAGERYGIRYEEALALECAYLRSKLEK